MWRQSAQRPMRPDRALDRSAIATHVETLGRVGSMIADAVVVIGKVFVVGAIAQGYSGIMFPQNVDCGLIRISSRAALPVLSSEHVFVLPCAPRCAQLLVSRC